MNIKLITQFLKDDLIQATEKSETIYWVVSFLKVSGVKEMLPSLQRAEESGAEIKILCGDYLYITEPNALRLLIDHLPNAHIRLFESGGRSFHPKAYLFRSPKEAEVFVGSSNLSKAALTNAVEWNVHVALHQQHLFFEDVAYEFMKLFTHPSTERMNRETVTLYDERYTHFQTKYQLQPLVERPGTLVAPHVEQTMEIDTTYETITPRPAQQLALDAIEEMRQAGYDKGLVVLATGLGKTFLAAFLAQSFKRVLFIAHREELLYQAEEAFQTLYPDRTTGIFNGQTKQPDADFVFASILTLSSRHHLHTFDARHFDLIVVDEFHHAVAPSYEDVLHYFHPQFLLGITATPDRLDNKDVYALCDGNVAISIHFIEAIQKGWLSPFVYYGVLDQTDYDQISWRNRRYDVEQLADVQLKESYAQGVFDAWQRHKQSRTIAFCSSVRQAEYLNDYFVSQNIRSIALHGQTPSTIRQGARAQLQAGTIDIIFTVDLFNEGVDIPTVDTLLFVRPTESLTVFTQQIGRGLRLAEGKEHCVIIDLIGNYRNVESKFRAFTHELQLPQPFNEKTLSIPNVSEFHFDTEVVQLIEHLQQQRATPKERVIHAFRSLKIELGKRPSSLQFYLKGNIDIKIYHTYFKSYPQLLFEANDLTLDEQKVFQQYAHWLKEIEQTTLTKSYKLVVLRCMLARGEHSWYTDVKASDIAYCFYQFFTDMPYRARLDWTEKQRKEWIPFNEKQMARLIRTQPMRYLAKNDESVFSLREDTLSVTLDVDPNMSATLYRWTSEIVEQRLHHYFERKSFLHQKKRF